MTSTRQRTPVTRFSSLVARFRVFALDNGLEIEERSGTVQLRRVLFEETQLLTLHQARSWVAATIYFLFALCSAGMGAAFSTGDETTAAAAFYGIAAVFLIPTVVYLVLPKHIITVTSLRARMALSFGLKKDKARQWFERLQQQITAAQQTTAAEVAQQNAAIHEVSQRHFEVVPMPPSEAAATPPVPPGPPPLPSRD